MRATVVTILAVLSVSAASVAVPSPAHAADLPAVKLSDKNRVPACVTPGRLMAFLKSRNGDLDARFDGVATEYMRHGEDLRIRWDVAFFQMVLETGTLRFGGDVQPAQNNFAGLGAAGKGERGESFKDVSTGVRAHLEHLLMYAGDRLDNPVAERTRKVQEWGVLTEWQRTIKGPMTFTQLARKWAPGTRSYAADIAAVADAFMDGPCKAPDPRPQLVAAARKSLLEQALGPKAAALPARTVASPPAAEPPTRTTDRADSSVAVAQAAVAAGAVLPIPAPTALVPPVAPVPPAASSPSTAATLAPVAAAPPAAKAAAPKPAPGPAPTVTVLNAGKAEEKPVDEGIPLPPGAAPTTTGPTTTALLAPPPARPTPPTAGVAPAPKAGEAGKPGEATTSADGKTREPSRCNVFTASYGGQKSVIIKAVTADSVNYTVLDVNEGAETRETEAYIAAYAKGGTSVGEFRSQTAALDKAFELCPER